MTTNDARPEWVRGQTIENADRGILDLCGARPAAANSFGPRRTARDESAPPRLAHRSLGEGGTLDALRRAKLGGIHDAFDFGGHVPEDLRPLSREGTGARCRRALPGNPDDIRVNHQTWIDVRGRRAGRQPAATRSLSLVQLVADGSTHAETPAVSAYHWAR